MILLSFILFLIAMTGIGVYSSTRSKNTTTDYILAGRDVGPIPMALSAVSTCHSGYHLRFVQAVIWEKIAYV